MDELTTREILLWVAIPYAVLAVFIVGHLWRYRRSQYTWTTRSSQLLERKWLRSGILLFHLGMLAVVGGHIGGLLVPEEVTESLGITESMYHFVAVAMGTLAGDPTAANATAAKEAIAGLRTVTEEHMAHEETEIEPVYQAKKDTPEIKEMGKKFSREGSATVGGNFIAWVTNGATDEELAGLRASIPKPVLSIAGKVLGRQYNRRVAPVWKN